MENVISQERWLIGQFGMDISLNLWYIFNSTIKSITNIRNDDVGTLNDIS